MMVNASMILGMAALPSAVSFAPFVSRCGSSSSALSYKRSDGTDGDAPASSADALTHQVSPANLQHAPTPSFLSRLGTEEDWKEWHYSFSRNGLTDFLPQFAAHISCLSIDLDTGRVVDPDRGISDGAVGAGSESNARLPWQWDDGVQATSSITSLRIFCRKRCTDT